VTEPSVPTEYLAAVADLTSHHIQGIAIQGKTPFACPLVSHVVDDLWQGGTPADAPGARVPSYFKYVVSLYPWQWYDVGPATKLVTYQMYDHDGMPEIAQLEEAAARVNEYRAKGPTLVHCQAGLNRSALVAGLALIRSGMTPDAAITLLRERRSPAVLCNATFEAWLRSQ
jgi:hypothetical protein